MRRRDRCVQKGGLNDSIAPIDIDGNARVWRTLQEFGRHKDPGMALSHVDRPRSPAALVVEGPTVIEDHVFEVDVDANSPASAHGIHDRPDPVSELGTVDLRRNCERKDAQSDRDED